MTFGGRGNKNRCVDKEDHDGVGDGGGGGAKQARKKMHLESFFNARKSVSQPRTLSRAICLPLFSAKSNKAFRDCFGHGTAA